jgi:cytochrome c oxidase assembly protein subunit 15
MGCPDWPKCFGQWVPPTSVDQLPEDYKDQYAAYRDKKNQKFARYLSLIGFKETSEKILADKSILVEADFNATKTWVEYTNRLVGVAIGLMIIALFIASWRVRGGHPELFRGSLLVLVLVIIQGWLGSVVVSTNLTSWTVTVHMFLALLIVAILVWLMVRSGNSRQLQVDNLTVWLGIGLVVLLVQIFLGTEVREELDRLSASLPRDQWIDAAGVDFILHRTFSWALPIIILVIWVRVRKTSAEKSLTVVPFLLILSSLTTGAAMAWFAVPPLLQPIHLLMAVVTFGWFYQVYLQASGTSENSQ